LGESLPTHRLFTLANHLKITEVAHSFGPLFPRLCINFVENGLGNILGDFSLSHLVTLLMASFGVLKALKLLITTRRLFSAYSCFLPQKLHVSLQR
jgi:hypothetical protein